MTKPYYEDDHVTLYHGDCREVTEWLDADAHRTAAEAVALMSGATP